MILKVVGKKSHIFFAFIEFPKMFKSLLPQGIHPKDTPPTTMINFMSQDISLCALTMKEQWSCNTYVKLNNKK